MEKQETAEKNIEETLNTRARTREILGDIFGLIAVIAVFEKFMELWIYGTARIWEDILWIRALETILFGVAVLINFERLLDDLLKAKKESK